MPCYPYRCSCCRKEFDVFKRISEIDLFETCPDCGKTCSSEDRLIAKSNIDPDNYEPEYNPGLGMVINSKSHYRRVVREKGLEEIGNEPIEKIEKEFAKRREDKSAANYRKLYEPYEVRTR